MKLPKFLKLEKKDAKELRSILAPYDALQKSEVLNKTFPGYVFLVAVKKHKTN